MNTLIRMFGFVKTNLPTPKKMIRCLVFFLAVGTTAGLQADETKTTIFGDSPFYVSIGLGFAVISEDINANYLGEQNNLTVDNDTYPILRAGYGLTENLSIEAGIRRDIYSGNIDTANADGAGSLNGYTFILGGVYRFNSFETKNFGSLRPLFALDIGYTMLDGDIDYPITEFDPAFGADLAIGLERNNISLRIGYRHYQLNRDTSLPGVNRSESADSLNLSGFFTELSYCFR
ncbi:MAG: porin family protein [Desulfobacteraceae bacterium]|nr:porin family protein [Desulfobacteraceae bacterium]